MASFLIRADVATITCIDAVVTAVAAALKPALPDLDVDERRLRAIMLLLHQQVPTDSPARTSSADAEDRSASDDAPPWESSPASPASPASPSGAEPSDPTSAPPISEAGADLADLAGIDLSGLLPSVQLFVHMYYGPAGPGSAVTEVESDPENGPQEPVVRVEGHGPVTQTWLRDVLGPTCRFTVTPVLDLAGQAPVDAYEIPDRHRRAVHLLTPADVFPHAASLSRTMQIDHTVPYDAGGPPGQSRIGNYGPMTTPHHRIKTHGRWQVRQPFPGIYLWRDPHGGHHLVDHTGTRYLRPTRTIDIVLDYDDAA